MNKECNLCREGKGFVCKPAELGTKRKEHHLDGAKFIVPQPIEECPIRIKGGAKNEQPRNV